MSDEMGSILESGAYAGPDAGNDRLTGGAAWENTTKDKGMS